ncbi:MAG: hypothetical protein Q4B85_11090 [Lachnospiraceae bacterium]|nr:hypothetical protein [Lachnospiraceae bacterium]
MMKISFINSGYAEGILIECPDDTRKNNLFRMVIDGGGARESEFAHATTGRIPMAEYLKKKGVDHIDLMVSTHTHEDHICGLLRCAELLPPGELWQTLPENAWREYEELEVSRGTNLSQTNFLAALNAYRHLCRITETEGGTIRRISAGYSCSPCKGLMIRVLAPSLERERELEEMMEKLYGATGSEAFLERLDEVDGKLNNFSLILSLEYCGKRILLPGDTNRDGFGEMQSGELQADLYKVGHHGQMDGASEELLEKIRPSMVVCCASSDRRYNSAHPDMIAMIRDAGAEVYYSDCPVEGVPPHQALVFTLTDRGEWSVEYQSV